jgi:SulP family sulfate permease
VDYGVQNLLIATMMAGVMLLAMGAFRLGSMIRFIPLTVVIGFTNGIAVVIFLAQIKDFLGLRIDNLPGEFFGKMQARCSTHCPRSTCPLSRWRWPRSSCCWAGTGWQKRLAWMRRLPGPLGVLVIATAVNA